MHEHGRKRATIVAALVLVSASFTTVAANAAEQPSIAPLALSPVSSSSSSSAVAPALAVDAAPAPATSSDRPLHSVSLFAGGVAATFETSAETVGAFLHERGIEPGPNDRVSPSVDRPLRNGMNVAFRRALVLTVVDGGRRRTIWSGADLVGDALATSGIRLRPHDLVSPAATARVSANQTISVVRIDRWTTKRRRDVPAPVRTLYVRDLAPGAVRTASAGRPGISETSTRFERRDDVSRPVSFVTRIVRRPQERVVERGIGRLASLAHLAKTGFVATMNFAGQAISMIATAYTAACFGCSGVTASGVRAGHGIVAVDPSVIPLGTRLFIPGYGSAVAGDTGGAIVGHRIDLGFDSNGDAMRFGRRPITVYVLKK